MNPATLNRKGTPYPVSIAQTHLDSEGATVSTCATCGTHFTPKRSWSRFCGQRCRNAFHAAEARLEAIRARAVQLYAALRQIADGYVQGGEASLAAQAATKGLKQPETPKALLEKAKA